MAITRLDARGRMADMILGMYERLRRRELISRLTFNLPLRHDQIADHLGITPVHVSRTLRLLREQRVVIFDRQIVMILDLNELYLAASRILPPAAPASQPEREDISGPAPRGSFVLVGPRRVRQPRSAARRPRSRGRNL